MQETWVPSLGWKEPLEEGVAAHSSILAGDPHGQSSPAGYSPWGHTESEQDLAHSKDLAHSNSGSSHSLSGPASKQANKAPPGQEVERSLEHSRPLMLLTPCLWWISMLWYQGPDSEVAPPWPSVCVMSWLFQIALAFLMTVLLKKTILTSLVVFLLTLFWGGVGFTGFYQQLPSPLKWIFSICSPFAFSAGINQVRSELILTLSSFLRTWKRLSWKRITT